MPKERETVTVEQLALSNAYQLEAMINIPERKGILTGQKGVAKSEWCSAVDLKIQSAYFKK